MSQAPNRKKVEERNCSKKERLKQKSKIKAQERKARNHRLID